MKPECWAFIGVERAGGVARVGGVLAVLLAVPVSAGAQSHCKGLEESACTPARACRWMPERVAGRTVSKATRQPHKTSAKAHCRLDVRKAAEIAAKQHP